MLGIGVSLRHLRGTTAGGFSPAALFAGGESGVWYEPGPTTAFKSTTDLTPCAAGDSCGFLLDQSKGAGYSGGAFTGLGTELVTNGTFDTDLTGWTVFGDCSVVSGEVVISDVGGTDGAISQQLSGVVTGDFVILAFDQSAGTNLFVQVGFFAGINIDEQFSGYGVGSHEIVFVAKRDAPWLTFRSYFTGSSNTIDNISVRELPGSHAVQATAAARPLLQSGSPDYLRDDLVDDALNWTAPADTDYTIARLNSAGMVTILTGQSLSGATDILLEQDVAGYVAVDRALTSQETTDLAAYLEALT